MPNRKRAALKSAAVLPGGLLPAGYSERDHFPSTQLGTVCALDELDVNECLMKPGRAPIQGEVLKKQGQIYRDMDVVPLLTAGQIGHFLGHQ